MSRVLQETTKELRNWRDLEQYGIIVLTGEACSIGMRYLCDLTQTGVNVLSDFFGGRISFDKDSNWNSSRQAVASVMLPTDIFQQLAVFCVLVVDRFPITIQTDRHSIVGVRPDAIEALIKHESWSAEGWEEMVTCCHGKIVRRWGQLPDAMRGRMQHAMSGRLT